MVPEPSVDMAPSYGTIDTLSTFQNLLRLTCAHLIQPFSNTVLSLLQTSLQLFLFFKKPQTASVCLQDCLHCRCVISYHLWQKYQRVTVLAGGNQIADRHTMESTSRQLPCSHSRTSMLGGMLRALLAICFSSVVFPFLQDRGQVSTKSVVINQIQLNYLNSNFHTGMF